MRKLLILRGAPGCGKSTFVKNNDLTSYTISTDDIRLQFMYSYSGSRDNITEISQEYNGKVFKYLFDLLETRMKYGLMTVIDATHSTTKEINSYRSLVEKYHYTTFLVDFTNVPIAECKKRNASREAFRVVPEEVIDRMYNNFNICAVPDYVTVISPEDINQIDSTETVVEKDKIDVIVDLMRSNPCIKEKPFGNISSFNFNREAFYSGIWDKQTIVARGLYINTKTNKVVARGFNKFFNIDERPETKLSALKNMAFPVTCYVKENGYLGLVSYNEETDDLFVTTKSSPEGDFSTWLRKAIFNKMSSQNIYKMKEYAKNNNVTFVFENVDMENDPHIIEYPDNKLYLIAIIKNQIDFEQYEYDKLVEIAQDLELEYKSKAFVINSYDEFVYWYNTVTAEGYKYGGKNIEGFVIEDQNKFMVKVKLFYYRFWKYMRGVVQATLKYGSFNKPELLTTQLSKDFYKFCQDIYNTHTREELDAMPINIIYYRKLFLKNNK